MRVTFEAPITRPVLAAGFFVGRRHIWFWADSDGELPPALESLVSR